MKLYKVSQKKEKDLEMIRTGIGVRRIPSRHVFLYMVIDNSPINHYRLMLSPEEARSLARDLNVAANQAEAEIKESN